MKIYISNYVNLPNLGYIVGKDNMGLLSDFFNFLEVLSSLWKLRNFFSDS